MGAVACGWWQEYSGIAAAIAGISQRTAAPEAERHRHHLGPDAGPEVTLRLGAAVVGFDHDGIALAESEARRRLRMDLQPAMPHHLGDRIWNFLEPGLVGASAVIEVRRWIRNQRVTAWRCDRWGCHCGEDPRQISKLHGLHRWFSEMSSD